MVIIVDSSDTVELEPSFSSVYRMSSYTQVEPHVSQQQRLEIHSEVCCSVLSLLAQIRFLCSVYTEVQYFKFSWRKKSHKSQVIMSSNSLWTEFSGGGNASKAAFRPS